MIVEETNAMATKQLLPTRKWNLSSQNNRLLDWKFV